MDTLKFDFVFQFAISLIVFILIPFYLYFFGMVAMGITGYLKSKENAKSRTNITTLNHITFSLFSAVFFPGKLLYMVLDK